MPPHIHHIHLPMENPIQTFSSPSPQLSSQGYGSHNQLQSPTWNGSPVRQNPQAQNTNTDSYSQQMNRYYQGAYVNHQNSAEINQYQNANSNTHQTYNSQYPSSRQTNYPNTNVQQAYPANLKQNYNATYYANSQQTPMYPNSDGTNVQQSTYSSASSFYPSKNNQCLNPPSNRSIPSSAAQQLAYGKQPQQNAQYSRYNSHYNGPYQGDSHVGYGGKSPAPVTVASIVGSNTEPMMTMSQANSQLSSIPTPPESNGPGDLLGSEGGSINGIPEGGKVNQISNSSFVLPGSTTVAQCSMSFSSSSVSISTTISNSSESTRAQNWSNNSSVPLQPPPNVDEGSQASSASASSSIPDEQNSMKASSKPNFSYPPTPNTLSSPGAASMSSFHDDLECISSPGWPRTPASPVAPNTTSYEFANIKRPESLLKLYSLSDDPERRYFLDKLIVFNEDRGSPITQCPTISKQPLDVFRVYLATKERGGFVEVTNAKRWKDIAGAIGVGASSSAAYTLRKQYMKLLLPFECKYDRGGIDPQPIINQVEASSRKKGKNAAPGNPNMCQSGYPQGSDGYPVGYQECYPPNSRYPHNASTTDYRYSSSSQYPQTSAVHPSSGGQQSYGQYPQHNQSQYGYYHHHQQQSQPQQQGGSSSMYDGNTAATHLNTTSNSACHYPANRTSSSSVNSSGSNYYNANYSMQQNYPSAQSNAYKYNSDTGYPAMCNSTGSVSGGSSIATAADTLDNSLAAAHINRTIVKQEQVVNFEVKKVTPPCDRVATPKVVENRSEGVNNDCTIKSESNSSSNESNESMCSSSNISSSSSCRDVKPVMQESPSVTPCVTPKPMPATHQSFQAVSADSNNNNNYPTNYRAVPTPPAQAPAITPPNPCVNYSNPAPYQPTYPQKISSNQYGPYTSSTNEGYRGSEGPPMYPAQSPVKYNCASAMSKDSPSPHPGNYPPLQNQHPKPNAYNQCASNYPTFYKQEQYQMGYPKDPYSNAKPAKAPGCGPNSSYSYQLLSGGSYDQNSVPEKRPFPDSKMVDPLQMSSRKPQPQSAIPTSGPSYGTSNKMQHHQPNSSAPPHPYMLPLKKPIEFPEGSVEAVKVLYRKRRRYSAKRVSPLDPWRLMLALKSGLLVESTWALDSISVLLCDNSSAVYFRLSHLPGLLSVLVEHYRRFLNKIFGLFEDIELKRKPDSDNANSETNDCKTSSKFNWRNRSKVLDSANFTFKTRCRKNVSIHYDEALFLIDPEQKWDVYDGFNVDANHWMMGNGEITDYVQFPFDGESGKVRFTRDMDKEGKDCEKDANNNSARKSAMNSNKSLDFPRNCLSEPVVLLKKCNFPQNTSIKLSEMNDLSDSGTKDEGVPEHKPMPLSFKGIVSKANNIKISTAKKCDDLVPVAVVQSTETNVKVESGESSFASVTEVKVEPKENPSSPEKEEQAEVTFPRWRSPNPQKRKHAEVLEDEAYCLDHPSLNLSTEYQEALIRRCMCVSNILRNLSFVPGNDLEMNKNYCFLLVLGRLLLLQHEHKPVKPTHRKYDKESDSNTNVDDSCLSLRDDYDWRGSLLHVLRDNTMVILSNIAGQLDLTPFPEEISLPILDGLLHWVTCPSSYARDPLPVKPSLSVLTPQRLSLEALCKLSVLDNNVDLMVATPPWSRIEKFFELLVKSLGPVEDKVVKEFAIVLLSSLSRADTSVARTIANQHQCISYLIGFIEQAEAAAFQIVSTQGAKRLKENPEMVGTTPNMVQRVADILKNLALVRENQCIFFRHQQRLLTLVTSQIIDPELATILAEVLFYCSGDSMDASFALLHS